MRLEDNTLYADEGKVLRRIADKMVAGGEYALGYTYYLGGEKLAEPKLETPDDFEEVSQQELDQEKWDQYPALVEKYIRERYSVSAELALLRQRDTKEDEFDDYYSYCEGCKSRAKGELGLLS